MIHEHALRQHAGWTKDSKMPLKYLHFFSNESSNALLQAYGVKTKEQLTEKLRPKLCPNCNEPNKPDSHYCGKCKLVLSLATYHSEQEQKIQKDQRLQNLEETVQMLVEAEKERQELAKYEEVIQKREKEEL